MQTSPSPRRQESDMRKVKIYLDDERQTPEGWIRTHTYLQTKAKLWEFAGQVEVLSLDHDLGEPVFVLFGETLPEETGYDVVLWLEEKAHNGNWDIVPDKIVVHSANPVGRAKMEAGIAAIEKMRKNFQNKG